MKNPRITVVVFLLVAVSIAIIVWNSRTGANLATEETPFDTIILPLKSIQGDIYLDGGSVWVGIEDSKGSSYEFVFPYDHKTNGYPTAFHGASAPDAPGAVSLTNPSRAKAIVLSWLRQSGRHDEGVEHALRNLSGQKDSIIYRVKRDGLGSIFK